MEKIMPPVYGADLRERLESQKLKQSQPLYNLLKNQEEIEKMNPSEIEELKGSLKQIDDKFDRLIGQVEDCSKLTESIHQKVKDIIWGIEASKNEE
jgi:predicted nuclease with TOPRIM domain